MREDEQSSDLPRYISADEACKILGVSRSTFGRLAKNEALVTYKLGSTGNYARATRYSLSEVISLIQPAKYGE